MARPEKIRLGDLLVRDKLITQDQLEFALEQQKGKGRKLGRVLVENGFISEEHISESLAVQFNIPYVNLSNYSINLELVRLLPESQARRFRAIVLEERNGSLLVGMSDPTDSSALDEVTRLVRRNIEVAVVTEGQLLQSIDRGYLRTEETTGLALGATRKAVENAHGDFGTLADSAGTEDASVTGLLKDLFNDAMRTGATDIHIEPQERHLKIRLRIDGVLHLHTETDNRLAPGLITRIKRMSALDISENRLPQIGRFHAHAGDQSVDVRIATMPSQYGECAVVRLSRQESTRLGLDDLGMPADMLKRFREIISDNNGLVLVTGPTGSGKTSLSYAALAEINSTERKIITVEDPVEHLMPGISQVQVDEKIKLTFSQALRSALLQDPDVLMVGEICDEETAQAALRAAMTGHLVLSTMPAADAASSLFRLMDMGLPRYMVVSSVQAVVAQRLLRRVCENCSESHAPTPQQGEWLKAKGLSPELWKGLRRGRGCAQCNGTGYRGRTGVYEMLEMGRVMAEAAAQGDAAQFLQAARQHMKGKTMLDRALELAKQGHTTVAEAMRASIQADE